MPDHDPRPFDETAYPEVRDDRLCDRFEFLLKAGQGVEVDDFLRAEGLNPADHPDLVAHLGRVEAHYRADGETRWFAAAPAGGPADLQPGMVFDGKYTLIKDIGGGGMGEVWEAQQERPVKRLVAVKVIKPGMDSRAVLARFDAERQALAVMSHDNIAKVYDAGTTPAGRPYFVMELVKGESITKFCDAHTLTPKQRMDLFVSVCEAIQHAHHKGVIHRDIKPSNVMVAMTDGRPVVKVIDFGIAKAVGDLFGEHTFTTAQGAILGTPEYMSPEQAGLNAQDIDMRSDVYSLGVLLYELLTGTTPVDRKSLKRAALAEVLRMVREVDAPRPSDRLSSSANLPSLAATRGAEPKKLTGQLRGEVDWILLRALEKDRRRRYESPNALAEDVRRHLSNEVVGARPPTPGYKLRKFVRRNRVLVGVYALATAVLMLGAFGAVFAGLWRTAEKARDEAAAQKVIADTARGDAETARDKEAVARGEAEQQKAEADSQRDKFERFEYGRTMQLAYQEWKDFNLPNVHLMLDSTRPELRGWEWHYLKGLCDNSRLTLGNGSGHMRAAAWSPDGKQIVTSGEAQSTRIWDANNGSQLHARTNQHDWAAKIGWSPEGEQIVFAEQSGAVRLWDVFKREEKVISMRPARLVRIRPPSYSPDRRWLLIGGDDAKSVHIRDTRTGAIRCTLNVENRGWEDRKQPYAWVKVIWNPNADQVVLVEPREQASTLSLWDAKSGRELPLPKSLDGKWTSVAWTGDGKKLATTAGSRLRVWDLTADAALCELTLDAEEIFGDSDSRIGGWSADGKRLLSVTSDGKEVRVRDGTTGRLLFALSDVPSNTVHALWSPDGRRFVTGSSDGKKVRVWDGNTGSEEVAFRGHTSVINTVEWSPDGSRLLTSSGDGTAKVWDLKAEQIRLSFPATTVGFDSNSNPWFVTPTGANTCDVWNGRSARRVLSLNVKADAVRFAVPNSDEQRVLITTEQMGQSNTEIRQLDTNRVLWSTTGRMANVTTSETWSPNGQYVLLLTNDRRTIKVWDWKADSVTATAQWVGNGCYAEQEWRMKCLNGGGYRPNRESDWSRDSRLFSTRVGSNVGDVRAWRTDTWTELNTAFGSLSPNGERALSLADDRSPVRLLAPQSGQVIRTFDVRFTNGAGLQNIKAYWSPDGRKLAIPSKDEPHQVLVVDTESGEDLFVLAANLGWGDLAWSPSGQRILTPGMDGELLVWDASSGQQLHVVRNIPEANLRGARWNTHGTEVLVSTKGDLRFNVQRRHSVVELTPQIPARPLAGWHTYITNTALWSPDGKRVLTAGGDHTARVYDAESGAELLSLKGAETWVNAWWCADGTKVITHGSCHGESTGTLTIYDAMPRTAKPAAEPPAK